MVRIHPILTAGVAGLITLVAFGVVSIGFYSSIGGLLIAGGSAAVVSLAIYSVTRAECSAPATQTRRRP